MSALTLSKEDFIDCHECNGSGKDQRKRTRACPACGGSGSSGLCKKCGKKPASRMHPPWEEPEETTCYCYAIDYDAI